MADQKITELPAADPLDGTESAPVVQAGQTRRASDLATRTWAQQQIDNATGRLDADVTVNVPTDYATLQAAVDAYAGRGVENGVRVIVNIETGYELPTGTVRSDWHGAVPDEPVTLWVDGVDASFIHIRSEDAVVPVEAGFDGSVIRNVRCRGVVLDCLIDMDSQGTGACGYSVEWGATGWVRPGCGVINAPDRGLWVRSSSTFEGRDLVSGAGGINFSGAGDRCVDVNHASMAYIREGNFSGGANYGLRARGAATIDAQSCDFSNCGEGANIAEGCIASLRGADVSDAAGRGITIEGSLVDARFLVGTGTIDIGAYLVASHVNLDNANLSGAGDRATFMTKACVVSIEDSNLSNAGGDAISAFETSTVSAKGADCSNSGRDGCRAGGGSRVGLQNADCSGASGIDINVVRGSTIDANGATGSLSQTANSVTAAGIIFK